MYFTKVFFILVIAITLYMNYSEAGQQAGKVGMDALKAAGGALKQGAKKLPPIAVGGYAANSTMNINVNTRPQSRPSSPSGDKPQRKNSKDSKGRR